MNLRNPEEYTILRLAEMIIRLTESKSKIVYKSLPEDDPVQRRPIIDLAKQELDWEPKVRMEEGMMKTIEYFKRMEKVR